LAENPDWREKVVNWLVLSMAHERLNHGEEARKWRTQAQEWIDQHTPRGKDSGFAPDGWLWRNWMMAQMLLREANGLKNQSPPSAN
jgi:hypothetical protein